MIQRESLFGTYPSDRILAGASERARIRGGDAMTADDVLWSVIGYLDQDYEAAALSDRDTIPAPAGYDPEPEDLELIGTEVEL